MIDIDKFDSNSTGSKGLIFIGKKILMYRRDGNTNLEPHKIDVPGGGPIGSETPFETFAREVEEEFRLYITRKNIVYARAYPDSENTTKTSYFLVAELPEGADNNIIFGEEGEEWFLMSIDEYLKVNGVWEIFRERTRDYLSSLI